MQLFAVQFSLYASFALFSRFYWDNLDFVLEIAKIYSVYICLPCMEEWMHCKPVPVFPVSGLAAVWTLEMWPGRVSARNWAEWGVRRRPAHCALADSLRILHLKAHKLISF